MSVRSVRSLAALLALAPLAPASTWIVDDDGGPGVDFTSIAAAIAIAGPGDVIVVRTGTYAGFDLPYGASILGDPGAVVTSHVQVVGLPGAPRATLAGLAMRSVRIANCSGPVTIEDATIEPLAADLTGLAGMLVVSACSDVRLRHVSVRYAAPSWLLKPAVHVTNARLEVGDSTLEGMDGIACGWSYPGSAQSGAAALVGAAGADLHVATSDLLGGAGGDVGGVECQSVYAGHGRAGIDLQASATALVTGTASDSIRGGAQGVGNACDEDGEPGSGIVNAGPSVRVSGATVVGEAYYPGCGGNAPPIVGPFVLAAPADPTLSFAGTQQPGQVLTFTVRGAPGHVARLLLGRQLSVFDVPTIEEDRLLLPLRTLTLGTLPPSGTLDSQITVPSAWLPGQLLVAQGRTTAPSGDEWLTHSLPITVR